MALITQRIKEFHFGKISGKLTFCKNLLVALNITLKGPIVPNVAKRVTRVQRSQNTIFREYFVIGHCCRKKSSNNQICRSSNCLFFLRLICNLIVNGIGIRSYFKTFEVDR